MKKVNRRAQQQRAYYEKNRERLAEYHQEYDRTTAAQRKNAGMCVDNGCPNKADAGVQRCATHRQAAREASQRYYRAKVKKTKNAKS